MRKGRRFRHCVDVQACVHRAVIEVKIVSLIPALEQHSAVCVFARTEKSRLTVFFEKVFGVCSALDLVRNADGFVNGEQIVNGIGLL